VGLRSTGAAAKVHPHAKVYWNMRFPSWEAKHQKLLCKMSQRHRRTLCFP